MQNSKFFKLSVAAILSLFLAACTTSSEDMGDSSGGMDGMDDGSMGGMDNGSSAGGNTGAGGLTSSEIRARDEALATTVFYFEFDRADLNADSREALVYHAQRLTENPSLRVRLEGHADERGTREYNLALGERRAQAVQRYLQVQGVSSSQLEVISYGEEQPVDSGSSEASYSRNRRVELK